MANKFLKLDLDTIRREDFLNLSVEDRKLLKAETKRVAALAVAAGYEVVSAGFGGVVMRVNPTDAGLTCVPFYEVKKMLA